MFRSLRTWQWCDLKGLLFNIFNVPLYNLCNGLVLDAVACDHEVTQWLRWEKIIVCVNILAASNVRQSLISIKVYKLVFHGFSFAYFSCDKCAPWCVMFSFTVEQKLFFPVLKRVAYVLSRRITQYEEQHDLLIKYPHLFFCLLTDWVLWWFGLAWIWNRMCYKRTYKHDRHNRHTQCSMLNTEVNAMSTVLCNYIRTKKERCLWWIPCSSGFDFVAFWMHILCPIYEKNPFHSLFCLFNFLLLQCLTFLGLIKLEPLTTQEVFLPHFFSLLW